MGIVVAAVASAQLPGWARVILEQVLSNVVRKDSGAALGSSMTHTSLTSASMLGEATQSLNASSLLAADRTGALEAIAKNAKTFVEFQELLQISDFALRIEGVVKALGDLADKELQSAQGSEEFIDVQQVSRFFGFTWEDLATPSSLLSKVRSITRALDPSILPDSRVRFKLQRAFSLLMERPEITSNMIMFTDAERKAVASEIQDLASGAEVI